MLKKPTIDDLIEATKFIFPPTGTDEVQMLSLENQEKIDAELVVRGFTPFYQTVETYKTGPYEGAQRSQEHDISLVKLGFNPEECIKSKR